MMPYLILLPALVLLYLIFLPSFAFAKPANNAYCVKGGCHNTADTTATQYAGRDSIVIANDTGSGSLFISKDLPSGTGRSFELDWYATNTTNSSGGYGAGVNIVIPTGWSTAVGTSSNPPWATWSDAWDITDGITAGWQQAATQTGVPAGYTAYLVNYNWSSSADGSNWEHVEADDDANDGHTGGAGGTDLDSTAEKMGVDAKITLATSASGTYSSLYLHNIGHEGNTRIYKRTSVTVNIANITSLTTSGGGSFNDTITVTLNAENTSSNALNSSTIDYVIFIDSNSNGEPDTGETYILPGGTGSGSWSSGLYTKQTTGFNISATSTNTDAWTISNSNFPQMTTYTIYAQWKESNGGTIDTANNTFYSVVTLGYFLLFLASSFFVGMLVKRGVVQVRAA